MKAFQSAEDAVHALAAAAATGDLAELETIFGPGGNEVVFSGDPVADRHQLEVFTVALDDGWTLDRIDDDTMELIVGAEEWPFPVPIAKGTNGWSFDIDEGAQEILARRVGRNELATIGTLRTYVVSQVEYAAEGHDGRPAGRFAQQVTSDPGLHNGLYWPTDDPEDPPSPLGEFAAEAEAEGYSAAPKKEPTPYRGYFYRILTRQGSAAPGGARNYIVDGEMTGGFAMLAYPAEYGNSGIMSFQVGPDGLVYESDFGADTAKLAGDITEYDPNEEWSPVDGDQPDGAASPGT